MKKSVTLLISLALITSANAQTLIWSKTSNPSSGGDVAFAITADATGIYVAGHDASSGNSQWRIEKRSMITGDTIWTQVVSYVISGQPFGIVADSTGIYVAGYDNSLGNEQIRIEKRNLNTGDTIWTKTLNPSTGVDWAQDIAIDNTGFYIVGQDQSPGNTQWHMEKRDLTTGDTIWTKTSNPSSGADAAEAVTVDSTGVYVVGQDNTPGNRQWRIEKRDLITGDTIWTKTSDLTFNNDIPFAITVDASGIYVAGRDYTGIPDGRWHIEKRELGTGDTLWTQTSDYSSSDDYVRGIIVDGTGIYLAGDDASPGNSQFRMEKRSVSTGDTVWVRTDNPSTGGDYYNGITINGSAIYVVGTDNTPGNSQWRIEKYSKFACFTSSSFSSTATTICEGETINFTNTSTSAITYQWLEDGILFSTATDTARTFNTAGTYTISLIADSAGCSDSSGIVITVNPTYNITDPAIAICNGDSISIYGTFRSVAATYFDSSITTNGCDSIVITELIVNPTFSVNDTVAICIGDSALLAGAYQTVAGSYIDTNTTANGCDSIVTTELIVNPTFSVNDTATICNGDSALLAGAYQTVAGSYIDTNTTVDGCDSIVTTELIVNPIPTVVIIGDTIACSSILLDEGFGIPGETYLWSTTETTPTITVTASGIYSLTVTDVNSCQGSDSINVIVNPTYSITDPAIDICYGDSVSIYGTFRSVAGTYYDSLTTVNGCDSIHSTVLTITTYNITDPAIDIFCYGDSVSIYGTFRSVAGTYYDSLTTINGCDSIHSTVLAVVNSTYTHNTPDKYICTGDSVMIFGIYRSVTGTYYDSLTTVNGCDSVIITALTVYVCTGVENFDFINNFKIYPNPNTGEFTLELEILKMQDIRINITNTLGQEIFTEELKQFKGTYKKQLDLNEFPAGIYTLQLLSDKRVISRKIIVE